MLHRWSGSWITQAAPGGELATALTWSEVAEICCTCSVTNFSSDRRSVRAAGDVLQPHKASTQHLL